MATIDKINLDRVRLGVQDAAYLAVGVGVIGFNQAQTRRREAQAQIGRLGGEVRERVEPVVTRLADNVRPTVGQAREAVQSAVSSVVETGTAKASARFGRDTAAASA